jgi:flagellar hook-associated protein 2
MISGWRADAGTKSMSSSVNPLLSSATNQNSALNLSNMLASASGATTPGIDVNAAVSAAIYAARGPERGWQADQVTLSNQATALTAFQNATQSLVTDLQSLNTLSGPLSGRTVSSSNSSYVTATATTASTTGVHNIVVNSLATKGAWYSDLASSPTATLQSSSMTLTTGSGSITIATGSGQTGDNLNDLAQAINGANLGVKATVVSDSTGSRLAIVSNSAGKANDFSITSPDSTSTSWTSPDLPSGGTLGDNSVTLSNANGASLTVQSTAGQSYADFAATINQAISAYNAANPGTPLNVTAAAGSDANGTNLTVSSTDSSPFTINQPAFGFTQASAATDAFATVDGVPIQSASNTIAGAIPGVSINLLGATQGSTISLTVAPDVSQSSNAINQFVNDYNAAINLVNAQFKMTTTTDSSGNTTQGQGVLSGDSTVRNLQNTLESALSFAFKPSSGTTTVSSLSDLGITMNNDGTLSVDSTTLNNALSTNSSDVQNFFQGEAFNGFASNFYNSLNSYTNLATGSFTLDQQSIQAQYKSLANEISDFESGYIAAQQTRLTAEFSQAEAALQSLPQLMQQMSTLLGFNKSNG